VILRAGLAMVLGAVSGFERESKNKPAGLRTHMLVAGAAALFVALSGPMVQRFGAELGSDLIASDPVRVIQGVIMGITFLGVGTIIRDVSEHRVEASPLRPRFCSWPLSG
jgi:putative Mg2+ transporter-C (MgtC) family protein